MLNTEIVVSHRGRKVTSLGVLFDFTGNDVNTTVQKVEDMVKEQWVRLCVLSRQSEADCDCRG